MKPDDDKYDLLPEEYTEVVGGELLKDNIKKVMQKKWYQSRTIWLAVGQSLAGIGLAVYSVNPALADVGWVLAVKSILDGYLRVSTKI